VEDETLSGVKLNVWLSLVLLLVLVACLPSSRSLPATLPATPGACSTLPTEILDGGWRFRTDPQDVGVAEQWYSPEVGYSGWQRLDPGQPWESSGIEYDGVAWYRTTVAMPDWPAVYLGFGEVDDYATLWVDGERAMSWEPRDGSDDFFDLSPFGQPGDDVHLAVRIEDRGGYGGIKSPVRLSAEPRGVMGDAEYIRWLAELHPDWPMPGWVHGHPLAWTMSAPPGAGNEALIRSDGAVAPWATAPTVEVWLYDPSSGKLVTGTGEDVEFSLQDGYLPLPRWEWTALDTAVENVLFSDIGQRATRWQVTVRNPGHTSRELVLIFVVRPFGINRSVASICSIGLQGKSRLWIDGNPFLAARTPPTEMGLGMLDEAMAAAVEGQVPGNNTQVSDPSGHGAAVWAYALSVDAGGEDTLRFAFPSAPGEDWPAIQASAETQLAEATTAWERTVGRVTIDVPDDFVARGVKASTAYLLLSIDSKGPHPGPLSHDSMWVRDAAYIGLALLQLGHAETVRGYVPDIIASQEPDGRVPPIQGSDIPWDADEWDAQGEMIFLATMYYRYTGEVDALRSWYPAVRAAAEFLVELRASQDESDPSTRGLLPPSKSAEDLGPADHHYYWDNFWSVVGLEEAAYAARELGRTEDAAWMEAEADALREAILDSVEAVMGPEPPYIPGSVEEVESSAMARGTVPVLWPVRVLSPDAPLLRRSFEHYYQRWIAPDEGGFRHRQGQFWPYGGLELAHAYLRLGRQDVLHEILGWTLEHQTLPGTFAWAEQVDPEGGGFSGGDMPHAWAAASYSTLVREMVVSENDGALELFTGVPNWWLGAEETIVLENAPTHFGPLNLRTESTVEQTESGWDGVLTLTVSGATPPQGFRWRLPQIPARIDGPSGTSVKNDELSLPSGGGTVQFFFAGE
jgi:hypothetical protein